MSRHSLQSIKVAESIFPNLSEKPKEILLRSLTDDQTLSSKPAVQTQGSISLSSTNISLSQPEIKDDSKPVPHVKAAISMESLLEELRTSLAEALYMERSDVDVDKTFIENRRRALTEVLQLDGSPIELRILPSEEPVQEILTLSEEYDEIVIGAPEERLLEQQLFGSVPQRVAENAIVNVIMVKRHDPIKHGLLGRWLRRVPKIQSYGQD